MNTTKEQKEKKSTPVSQREETILHFWKEHNIFKKTEGQQSTSVWGNIKKMFGIKKEFVFYDGPPFATGLPHYGHILASSVKDALPRYKTMKGHQVRRRWGWDCHGLPLEVEVEKELGLSNKQDIEKFGIKEFNATARKIVLRYTSEWEKFIPRIGRWVDMENAYRTLSPSYMESVWNVFHRLHKNGFVEKGFKSLHICPRCATTLSNTEVSDSYEMLTDTAVFTLFPIEGEENTFAVAWTTTPWTLFGNVALGVHKDLTYIVLQKGDKKYIIQESKKELIPEGVQVDTRKGAELIGKTYKPPFDELYKDTDQEKKENLFKIHHASYVTAETGTGIVHLAPAYGAEDMELAQEKGIPIVHHVTKEGIFVSQLGEFAGILVKEKGNAGEVDKKIVAALETKGLLLKSETIEHNYPVCWRCKTPLLNYATDSWFVRADMYRDDMVRKNKRIGWVPEHIRDGRFGNWLKNAKEWSVSRSRFWGTPLPIWEVEKTGEHIFVSSIEDMMSKMQTRNRYTFVRHAQSKCNVAQVFCSSVGGCSGLTEQGMRDAEAFAQHIHATEDTPTILFSSPLKRTKQTAEKIAEKIGIPIKEDALVKEKGFGIYEGKEYSLLADAFEEAKDPAEVYAQSGVETPYEVMKRVLAFLEKVDRKYENEHIMVVTHKSCVHCADALSLTKSMFSDRYTEKMRNKYTNLAKVSVEYKHVQRDERGEVDLHRPFIDDIVLYDAQGNPAHNVKEVFDCWFESGSMPYASNHYPFENTGVFNPNKHIGFPADFICEGLDQTRGWFYSLIAIGVGAFKTSPYKQVIVTGLIRGSDGRKMSKSLRNYPDPNEIIELYGADTLRHYLLGSQLVRGNDINFDETQVHEIYKKVYTRFLHCLNFYKTYIHLPHKSGSTHELDIYILSRLSELVEEMTHGFETYQLDKAVAPVGTFVDDLSTWYLRRARTRMRGEDTDGAYARETMHEVLITLSKCLAPIAPFMAEFVYQEMRAHKIIDIASKESVHLCQYPKAGKKDNGILHETNIVRSLASLAHEQRVTHGIKVRQPLEKATVQENFSETSKHILREEINVKHIEVDKNMKERIVIDTHISETLQEEGMMRECIRAIQSARKANTYSIIEVLESAHIYTTPHIQKVLKKFEEDILRETRIEKFIFVEEKPSDAIVVPVDEGEIAIKFTQQVGKIF